ncbi:MAG: lipoprotein [Caulobacterales bacterium]|jgi:hypothetical protein
MRRFILAAVAAVALAGCASSPPPAPEAPPRAGVQSAGTWAFSFDPGPGLASATLTGADGKLLVRMSCQAPRGDLQVNDWTFERAAANPAVSVRFGVGAGVYPTSGAIGADGGGRNGLSFSVPSRDPVFRGLNPTASVTIATPTRTHTLAPGAAVRLNDVLNSCRATGS